MIQYKDLSEVDLQRNSRVRFHKRISHVTPVANACGLDLVESDFATDEFPEADGVTFNPTWAPYIPAACVAVANPGFLQIISNELHQGIYSAVPGPAALRWSGFPIGSTHQSSRLIFRGVDLGGVNQAWLWLSCRMNQVGVGDGSAVNLTQYALAYILFYAPDHVTVQGTGLTLYRRIAPAAPVVLYSLGNMFNFPVPVAAPGDELKLLAVNLANTNVCLDFRMNDVSKKSHIDSNAARILTGQPGIGWGFTASNPGNLCLGTRQTIADSWRGQLMVPA